MKTLKECLLVSGIFFIVDLLWQAIELYLYGAITPSIEDTGIGIILAISLYVNFKFWEETE